MNLLLLVVPTTYAYLVNNLAARVLYKLLKLFYKLSTTVDTYITLFLLSAICFFTELIRYKNY